MPATPLVFRQAYNCISSVTLVITTGFSRSKKVGQRLVSRCSLGTLAAQARSLPAASSAPDCSAATPNVGSGGMGKQEHSNGLLIAGTRKRVLNLPVFQPRTLP